MSVRKTPRLTPEEISAINTRAGKAARKASPWNKHPMCGTERAAISRMRYVAKAKRLTPARSD